MGVILEPITLICRAGLETNKFGDPYSFAATIILDNGVAHIKGAAGVIPGMKDTRELFAILKDKYGVSEIKWERLKDGKTKEVINIKDDE